MASARAFGSSMKSIPFALYRSGTSRGVYVLESDVPPKGPKRDAVLCKLMGSGHPQQLEGFGGGCGPTSKAVVVGAHPEAGTVTFSFAQCSVDKVFVDHSHGDCGNMLAAVAPFALERGLVALPEPASPTAHVRIHSLNTGAIYAADTRLTEGDGQPEVCYQGDFEVAGVPGPAAPVVLTTYGVSGSQTGKLLPTGNPTDLFDLGQGLGSVTATVVDFARALVMVDAAELMPKFGYSQMDALTKQAVESDAALNAALENVRRAASLAIGMGDCAGKDAPKVAIIGRHSTAKEQQELTVACRYFVNPERSEMHPTVAQTASQAIGAACLLKDSVAWNALQPGLLAQKGGESPSEFTFQIAHPKGQSSVTIGVSQIDSHDDQQAVLYPYGLPESAKYATTVKPVAEGRAFL
eukprot:TRINITY_DN44718_c2_g1_i1.p1 TRINITY_DN44718_c2_g1~~TRINITY_DN44718_c2_g1_i1.p1  ORF type:complete len:409 (+),score=50.36 TRINITY_DN44718_c2_g1_i1:93-1319(+)